MDTKSYFHGISVVVEPDENFKEIRLPISLVKYIEDLAKTKAKYLEEHLEWLMKNHSDT